MAPQADGVIANASGAAVRADLNNQLAALFTNHSGATQPATTYPYQWWADTTAGQLKLRNAANDGWVTIQELDGTMLMEDGTVGAPGLAFASDLDTGFYRPADNELGIATGGTNAVYIDDAQQVGLGTSSPETPAHIYHATANGVLRCESGDEYVHIEFKDSTTTNIPYIGAQGDNLRAITSGSEAVRIDSSGRLLCGTSSSTSNNIFIAQGATSGAGGLLAIARNNNTPGSTDAIASLNFATSVHETVAQIKTQRDSGTWTAGSSYPTALLFSTTPDGAASVTERMRIRATGVVGTQRGLVVGNLTGGVDNDALIISGGVIGSGAGTYPLKWNSSNGIVTYDTSSRLVKENIIDCPYGIAEVKQLQPRKYLRTDDQREEIGFVADELVAVLPEFVPLGPKSILTKDENDTEEIPLGVNYEKLTAVLTKALQEAMERIETLEERLNDAGIA